MLGKGETLKPSRNQGDFLGLLTQRTSFVFSEQSEC